MNDLYATDGFGEYKIGLHYIELGDGSLMDIRAYGSSTEMLAEEAQKSIKRAIRINAMKSYFKCGCCGKKAKVSRPRIGAKAQFNQANPSFPLYDSPICDDCHYENMLGLAFEVKQ